MILVDAAGEGREALSARLIFAAQLRARGHQAVIDGARLPADPGRGLSYEALDFAVDSRDIQANSLILLGADRLSQATLDALALAPLTGMANVTAIGRFPDKQSLVAAQSRLAHVLRREPKLIDLTAFLTRPLLPGTICPPLALPMPEQALHTDPLRQPRLALVLADDTEITQDLLAQVEMLHFGRLVRVSILTGSRLRDRLTEARATGAEVLVWGDLSPLKLAERFDLLWIGNQGGDGTVPQSQEPLAAMVMAMLGAGRIVIDGSAEEAMARSGAPVLRGPEALAALGAYLEATVLPNRDRIAAQIMASHWLSLSAFGRLEPLLDLSAPSVRPTPTARDPRIVFMPTNGVGLGHAQRTTLIADEMAMPDASVFAAFPSCLPLIAARGFAAMPLVAKSDVHAQGTGNDMLTYARLRRITAPGDTFVFDGSHIFESVWRTIVEKRLRGIWIRRGLWRASQIGRPNQRREAIFNKVIVPGEAFDELNDALSFGDHVHAVGPIVRRTRGDRDAYRKRLSEVFDVAFDRLVVTMLGAGVAADRSLHLHALAQAMERRSDVLHLMVIWPGSVVPPGLDRLQRSRLVQTRDAAMLTLAADLCISAVGYNSFHEAMYNRVPTIFLPQDASMMDDQSRRARAAVDRGLALIVGAKELLTLDRHVSACLDSGKADDLRKALANAVLPAPGLAEAAALIREEALR